MSIEVGMRAMQAGGQQRSSTQAGQGVPPTHLDAKEALGRALACGEEGGDAGQEVCEPRARAAAPKQTSTPSSQTDHITSQHNTADTPPPKRTRHEGRVVGVDVGRDQVRAQRVGARYKHGGHVTHVGGEARRLLGV